MSNRLEDKVVVLTGAATGIGQCFSYALTDEGAKLVINYFDKPCNNTIAVLEEKGADFIAVEGDISREEDTKNIAAKAMEKYGRIDVLINCAAIFGDLTLSPIMHIEMETWNKIMDVNITGNFLMCRAILPEMAKQKSGVVLNIGSTIWLSPKMPLLPYITSKAALVGFTRCLAADPICAENNIRVNCLMPGGTWDEATAGLLDNVPDAEESVINGQTIKRKMMPEDLVGPMLFLITEDSNTMTGNSVAADMGFTVW